MHVRTRHICLGFVAVGCATTFATAQVTDIDVTAPDGTKLRGTYSSPGTSGPGIVLFHQCNMNRHAWTTIRELRNAGHGVPMFESDKALLPDLGGWLANVLRSTSVAALPQQQQAAPPPPNQAARYLQAAAAGAMIAGTESLHESPGTLPLPRCRRCTARTQPNPRTEPANATLRDHP